MMESSRDNHCLFVRNWQDVNGSANWKDAEHQRTQDNQWARYNDEGLFFLRVLMAVHSTL